VFPLHSLRLPSKGEGMPFRLKLTATVLTLFVFTGCNEAFIKGFQDGLNNKPNKPPETTPQTQATKQSTENLQRQQVAEPLPWSQECPYHLYCRMIKTGQIRYSPKMNKMHEYRCNKGTSWWVLE
jgi:hypothetical protein